MVRDYYDLAEQEQNTLADAWVKVSEALELYESVTGAVNLDNIIHDELWDAIYYQKSEQNDDGEAA